MQQQKKSNGLAIVAKWEIRTVLGKRAKRESSKSIVQEKLLNGENMSSFF